MTTSKEQILIEFHKKLEEKWINTKGAFEAADENGDGNITREEFKKYFKQFGMSDWLEKHGEELFKIVDSSEDGDLDLEEFNKAIEGAVKSQKEEQVPVTEIAPVEVDDNTRYISLVAHNEMKSALKSFVEEHKDFFSKVPLVTTGSTGRTLKKSLGIPVEKLVASGPLGGDQAIGGMISEEKIAAIFFFKDPLSSHAHAADIEALTRLCDVHQIPYATNPASAIGILMLLKEFGTDWQLESDEGSIVDKYKKAQSKVIQSVSNQ